MWQISKQELRKYPHWDDYTTRGLILEGWSHVSQEYINERVSTMPERLQAVIDGEGKMTGYQNILLAVRLFLLPACAWQGISKG